MIVGELLCFSETVVLVVGTETKKHMYPQFEQQIERDLDLTLSYKSEGEKDRKNTQNSHGIFLYFAGDAPEFPLLTKRFGSARFGLKCKETEPFI